MSDEERQGPIGPRCDPPVRRGRESNAAKETRAFLESHGIPVQICETCGQVAGTNDRCEECSL